jgi:hypothetical protein
MAILWRFFMFFHIQKMAFFSYVQFKFCNYIVDDLELICKIKFLADLDCFFMISLFGKS